MFERLTWAQRLRLFAFACCLSVVCAFLPLCLLWISVDVYAPRLRDGIAAMTLLPPALAVLITVLAATLACAFLIIAFKEDELRGTLDLPRDRRP
jgi:hypothetical protein